MLENIEGKLNLHRLVKDVAAELGVVPYFPPGEEIDRKTNILFFTREDALFNEEVDKKYGGPYAPNSEYRLQFWEMENTDANGELSNDFANHGAIDLRGQESEVRERIKDALLTALYDDTEVRSLIAEQECEACGRRFKVQYVTTIGRIKKFRYEYVDTPCECDAAFHPVDGAPSISEWLEQLNAE